MQYKRREGGGSDEELAEESRKMLLWRRVSAILPKEGCPGTFSQSKVADSS